jgi:hypothetical protein
MADDLDFSAEEFLHMSSRARVRLCRKLAERAQALAGAAEPHHRDAYAKIAEQWRILADEIERSN